MEKLPLHHEANYCLENQRFTTNSHKTPTNASDVIVDHRPQSTGFYLGTQSFLEAGDGEMGKRKRPYSASELAEAYNEGRTITELAEHFSVSRKIIQTDCARLMLQMRKPAKRNQFGSANANWGGGCVKQGKYRYLKDRGHPNATKTGYVAEHIVVALKSSGRTELLCGECVHHIDMDKQNNRPENLSIQTRKTHAKHHEQLQRLAIDLLFKKGIINYDHKKGYFICG
jgi:hypothetical protein